ncbi:MAG: tetratricopeptide repeat protein [Methylococcales bacterium]|nr:tetratricopeptide repeat protein [Methylococcales bacterium]
MKRLFLLCSLPVVLTGCAEFYDSQPPAPVYGNGTPLYGNTPLPQEKPTPIIDPSKNGTDTVKTAPLKGGESTTSPRILTPETLPSGQSILTLAQEQELAALQQKPFLSDLNIEQELTPKPKPVPVTIVEPVIEPPIEPEVVNKPSSFEPLQAFTPMSPVVNTLVLAANEDNQKGNVESATTTLERASRIEPRNATLYYKLALLKLKSNPSQAENLAKKSAQLAANDASLKKHSWLLVAKAREMQNNFDGAKEARERANKF